MRVVVTGAQGFVGRHLVEHLHGRGHAVTAIDVVRPAAVTPGVNYVAGDIRQLDHMGPALAGADVVVHLASAHLQVGLPESFYQSVNVESLYPLLETARAAGVRHFIHTSSVGVHGSLPTVPGNEDSPLAPENLYERTKAAGEAEVRRFMEQAGPMGVTILRPAWIYGVGDSRTEKILRAVSRGRFVTFGEGRNHRHPIHIDDYLAGQDRVMLEPKTFGRTYILAGPQYLTANELVAVAARVTGGRPGVRVPLGVGYAAGAAAEALGRVLRVSPPISRRTLAFFSNENAFDTSRARSDFGFAPLIDVEHGFAQVWAAMGARG